MENYSKSLHSPDDIMSKILIRLPPKSLLRFTIVSKSWQNLIQSHKFIHSHIKHNNNKPTQLIFYTRRGILWESVDDDLKSLILSTTPMHLNRHRIIGHCNGIICLDERKNKSIILWNPTLHQCRRVRFRCLSYFPWHFAGFGYDGKNQDYKILLCSNTIDMILRYSLKTGMWRKLSRGRTTFAKSYYIGSLNGCLCFDGKLHWTTTDKVERRVKSLFIFNLADDKFSLFAMPISSLDEDTPSNLGVFRRQLSFVKRKFDLMTEEFQIWSTADPTTPTSWIKALSISPTRLSLKTPFLRSMGLDHWRAGYIHLTSNGKVFVELSIIPSTVTVPIEMLKPNERSVYSDKRIVEYEFISTECALLYDEETHHLEVYKYDAKIDFTWYAITDYLESLVPVESNTGWRKIANYLLAEYIWTHIEVIFLVFCLCFISTIVTIVVLCLEH